MSKEKKRLLIMLKENKISENDYNLLSSALDKRSIFTNIESSLLINPFQRIAGFKALLIGLAIIIVMSMLGIIAKVYFDGIFGCLLAINFKTHLSPNFYLLLYQNVMNWLVLTTLFIASAMIFKQKRIRIIDFFGTVVLARYPYLILVGSISVIQIINPTVLNINSSQGYELHLNITTTILSLFWTSCFVWQLMTYFFALKESSGLEGKRLWASYIISLILGDIISIMLARVFFYT